MPSSLEKLVKNLYNKGDGVEDFRNTKQVFGAHQPGSFNTETTEFKQKLARCLVGHSKVDLMLRKGVYPYEYIKDAAQFTETDLLPKSAFYSSLTGSNIKDVDYVQYMRVWRAFSCKNLGIYHDIYLAADVSQLSDVFESFRDLTMKNYGLDPCWYFTAPSVGWDAALKMSGIKLELLTDPEKYLFFESPHSKRGGISIITHRHAKANNPYVPGYDSDKNKSYIIDLDANNLYGGAMKACLPFGGFKWLTPEKIQNMNSATIMNWADDSLKGVRLEVDLEYPEELHDLHNDYPLAPENLVVKNDMLSKYAKEMKLHLGLNISGEGELKENDMPKLIPNLLAKKNYIISYRALKCYLSHGMILKKIHRGIEYFQKPWLASYIDYNTSKRKQAKNEFEKDFYKLMNNSVFGKTMENLRNRIDFQLVNDADKGMKLQSKANFRNTVRFNEELVGYHMNKNKITLNKPVFCGVDILDESKITMYNFHYNYIKKQYGNKATLLATDTDSLKYVIETNDLYSDFLEKPEEFDFSDYPEDHRCYNVKNKKVVLKMKDETNGDPISEFVGLRAKMYSQLVYTDKKNPITNVPYDEKKRAKGIARYVVADQIRHQDYVDTIVERKQTKVSMTSLRSYKHEMYTINVNKTGLSAFDDKRYLLADGISSYAYGHRLIPSL
jgi:hypothetical protein